MAAMNLEVITHGTGSSRYPPIVFVHGGFHAAWCWDEYFLPYFCAHGFDVHALSLRGHGKSDGREELDRWGLADYCADVAQVCRDLPECPVVVGHSIGAVIVQQYVQTHMARAIVLVAPTPLASMPLEKLRWSMRHPLATAKMVIRQDILAAEQDRIPKSINERLARSFSGELETLPLAHDVMLAPRWRLAADRIIDWIAAICETSPS